MLISVGQVCEFGNPLANLIVARIFQSIGQVTPLGTNIFFKSVFKSSQLFLVNAQDFGVLIVIKSVLNSIGPAKNPDGTILRRTATDLNPELAGLANDLTGL